MKKSLPYILALVVLVAAGILIFTDNNQKKLRLDERLSLRSKEKVPYGTFAAFEGLKYMFPNAEISISRAEPGFWDSLDESEAKQAVIIISPRFLANEYEMGNLIGFANKGNDVFISSPYVSQEVSKIIKCGINYLGMYSAFGLSNGNDSLTVSLANPPFVKSYSYTYPGKRFSSFFYNIDSSTATILGYGEHGLPNFIHLRAGFGNVYLHLAPMTFTNYFLLKDRNYQYYEDLMSLISADTKAIIWDEYYLNKKYSAPENDRKGWVRTFLQHESLKLALITALLTLLLYTLMEMRRKQRPIPVLPKPRNDSMEFVKTIGRLYYDKGDHRNLSRKMSSYFLEHVRNRYKIPTAKLNEDFIEQLQFKTGIQTDEIRNIVQFIQNLEIAGSITDKQLAYFHKQLESFYSKT